MRFVIINRDKHNKKLDKRAYEELRNIDCICMTSCSDYFKDTLLGQLNTHTLIEQSYLRDSYDIVIFSLILLYYIFVLDVRMITMVIFLLITWLKVISGRLPVYILIKHNIQLIKMKKIVFRPMLKWTLDSFLTYIFLNDGYYRLTLSKMDDTVTLVVPSIKYQSYKKVQNIIDQITSEGYPEIICGNVGCYSYVFKQKLRDNFDVYNTILRDIYYLKSNIVFINKTIWYKNTVKCTLKNKFTYHLKI
jgi:hypothetical protein